MNKLLFRYDQSAARLQVEGLPDFSQGHSEDVLGILSSWKLQFVGSAELEGKRDHLQAMMSMILPYARHRVSGISREFGHSSSPVSIAPNGQLHQLLLRSSQLDVEPLTLNLDDAELSDLVRCLDSLRLDPRVKIPWNTPIDLPLARTELAGRSPLSKRISAPLAGGLVFIFSAVLGLVLPIPNTTQVSIPTALEETSVNSEKTPEN